MIFATMTDIVETMNNELSIFLALLQQKLKYGLPTNASIGFYEIGFADRVVSLTLAAAFPEVYDRTGARDAIRRDRARTSAVLAPFPSYFTDVFREVVGN